MASTSATDFFENWTVQTRKGLLELCILNALVHRERYGYYSLTPSGKKMIAMMNTHFDAIVQSIEQTRDGRRMK